MSALDPALLSHARHELRTPLNHLIGYSEMLLEEAEGGDAKDVAESLRRVHADARRLLVRVNEALSVERAGGSLDDFIAGLDGLSAPISPLAANLVALREAAELAGAETLLPDIEKMETAAARLLVVIGELRPGAGSAAHDADVIESIHAMGAAAAGPAATGGAASGPGALPSAATDPGVILVVDDNASNREILARRLARQGHEIVAVESGQQALDAAAARPFDLILLDVLMPGLSGVDVLRRLKADDTLREVPVLMISALDETDSVVRSIELGAEDYLPKPFDPILLRARVGACLEKKRLRDQQRQQTRELAEWNRTLEERVAEQVAQMDQLGRLKRFFSPQLAEMILAGGAADPLKTHRREITVVFLDLRGFTAFAESAEPEELMGVLREYHAAMGQLIMDHEGTLERFTGDGMMIFFNDPVVVANPSERAIRMAIAMHTRVKELTAKWRKLGYELDLGIGIAQGYATIGAIGFEGRWDYGALGTVTNLSARLCGEARGGEILISRRVAGAVEDVAETEALDPLTLKGFARPVPAARVLGLKPGA